MAKSEETATEQGRKVEAIRYQRITAEANELTSISSTVPAWVVPVLEQTHDVEVIEDVFLDIDLPGVADEMARLEQRYGRVEVDDDGRTSPAVHLAYGMGPVGEKLLEQAMHEAVVEVDITELDRYERGAGTISERTARRERMNARASGETPAAREAKAREARRTGEQPAPTRQARRRGRTAGGRPAPAG